MLVDLWMVEFGSTLARYISLQCQFHGNTPATNALSHSVSKAAVQAMTQEYMTEHGSADWVKQIPLTSDLTGGLNPILVGMRLPLGCSLNHIRPVEAFRQDLQQCDLTDVGIALSQP